MIGPKTRAVVLALTLSVVAANATHWVFVVPIFQAPDEDLHFDYAISIYTAGRLLWTAEKPVAQTARFRPFAPRINPLTHHLMLSVRAEQLRFLPNEKVPAGYGSREFFRRIEARAPKHIERLRNPWLLTEYPFLHYGLTAVWMKMASLWDDGVVTLFFAARVLSVVFLLTSLIISYCYFRRLGTPPVAALVLIATIGLFPYTAFVASSVQPDNLALTLVMLSAYTATIARDNLSTSRRRPALLFLGLALGALLVTKYHFFLTIAVPIAAMLVVATLRFGRRRWRDLLLLTALPSIATGLLQWSINQGNPTTWLERKVALRHAEVLRSLGWPEYLATRSIAALKNYFAGGNTWRGFWGRFGWNDTPLVIGSEVVTQFLAPILLTVSVTALVLVAIRLFHVISGLRRVAGRRGVLQAATIAVSNPLANGWLVFTGFMLFLYGWMDNYFAAQARQWFPFAVALFWLMTQYAPRALTRRSESRLISYVTQIALLAYAIIGAIYAIPSLKSRYY